MTLVTDGPANKIPAHTCPGLHGLTVPLLPAAEAQVARRRLNIRQDYVGQEQGVAMVDGRPVSSVQTLHPDGSESCVVLAPVARGYRMK